jgi:acyl-homoserine lactone acylase PvdQ
MEKLVQTNSWTPNAIDSTPAGSQTLTAYRTVHGVVYARGTVHGKKVAFARARSTYFHEADAVIGFSQLNDPGFLTGPARFKKAVSNLHFLFNWAYIDSKHIAYALSGDMPQRAKGTSPDFPVFGTGKYDWRHYKPRLTKPNASLLTPPAGGRPALPRLLEQQAGPGWAPPTTSSRTPRCTARR